MNENLTYKFTLIFDVFKFISPSSNLVNRFSFVLLFFLPFFSSNLNAQLIISEYYEGASNDKCIEIYNTTNANINLTGYSLRLYVNGSSAVGSTVALSGTILACDVFVVCNSSSNATLLGAADLTSANLTYNGDDAVELWNGSTRLDLFGNIGDDPGTEWTGVGAGTADDAFTRTSANCSGVTADPSGTGATAFTTFTTSNWSSSGLAGSANLGSFTNTCGCGGCSPATEPTTNSSSISITPAMNTASITFTIGNGANRIAVISTDCSITAPVDGTTYAANSTYGAGATTAAGDYVVFNGSGNNFSITGLSASTSYCIQIFEFNGTSTCVDYLTSSVLSTNFTTTASSVRPYLTGIMINACDASCAEGNNEIIFGTTADYALAVSSANLDIRYGTTNPGSTTYTDALSNVTATTTALNTACPGTFLDGFGATIPVGGKFMVVRSTFCPSDYTWTNLCGTGPIYVIYTSDASWVTAGNFDNSGTAARYFRFNSITTTAVSSTVDYNYTPNDNPSAGNGAFIRLDSDGGLPVAYTNTGCVVTLPVNWGEFESLCPKDDSLSILWTTLSERNNDYFTLEQSYDGNNFFEIAKIKGAGNSNKELRYNFKFTSDKMVKYFRLKQTDFNGKSTFSQTITSDCANSSSIFAYPNPTNGKITIGGYDKDSEIFVSDEMGRRILSFKTDSTTSVFDLSDKMNGIYFITVNSDHNSETLKINLNH